ncbi:MAG TPA: valine--tRNA ligase [Dehalococcoidia bacterium]|nr:valine--tRNA ligase [Dehalococcoidia bacterium]
MAEAPKDEMPKAYEPGKVEQKWYRFWLDKGYFTPKVDPKKKPFVVIMPLPNVTGGLHMGHVCFLTPEDIMTRWHRMKGEAALWLPGIDHAGIAAQVVVEQQLAQEGTDRHKLGRERFQERMYKWAEECRRLITGQEQRIGSSCDWSREQFTLEAGPSRAVRTAFVRLYDKGLIYRGERIINWCPRCATALSDLETDHKDIAGHLYYVRYPLEGEKEFITVATTRPETILGDTAVAVNPRDKRFKAMVGKKVILPAVKRVIPIIADEAVDPEFGTGAVKITPAHDPVDFEVAQRHDLPLVNILEPGVTMNQNAGKYAGLDRFDCRQAILDDLEKDGLLVKVEPYSHSVGHCMRCQTVIEPIASQQWFIKTEPLAKPAIEAITSGRISIIPSRFTKVYLNWMENIRDWCISRQLWWGHRIPVWYCRGCGEITAAVDQPGACPKCGSADMEQDPDVLDTWFSSALWTHSTMGWPDDTPDLGYFYPTTVMETGYDILFFWVARMIMMGLEDTGDIPFSTVYLHGLLRDEKGEKMSKVRGNVLDPLDTIDKYGTDALRFALTIDISPGNDINLTPARLEAGRNFANKLWNAARFVVRSIGQEGADVRLQPGELTLEDRWILSRLSSTNASVVKLMDNFQFGEAQRQLHDFLWGEFCDWYIEFAKIRLSAGEKPSPLPVLVYVLETSLRLLHPFMPFVTEELWQNLKKRLPADWQKTESIMIAPYPEAGEKAIDPEAERVMGAVIEIIHAIRNARAEHKVESGRWVEAQVFASELTPAIAAQAPAVETLARARPLSFLKSRKEAPPSENVLALVLKNSEVIIPMESMVDLGAEQKRLQNEAEKTRTEVASLEARLKDKAFLTKAPPAVVKSERDKLAERKDKLERLKQQLARFQA